MMPFDFIQVRMLLDSLRIASNLLLDYETMVRNGCTNLRGCEFDFLSVSKGDWTPENSIAYARDGVNSVIAWITTEQAWPE